MELLREVFIRVKMVFNLLLKGFDVLLVLLGTYG